jgi:hypothetical protein
MAVAGSDIEDIDLERVPEWKNIWATTFKYIHTTFNATLPSVRS